MGLEQQVITALEAAGNKNRYQFIVVALLALIFYFDAFMLQGATFYFMDPTFICDGSDDVVDQLVACDKLAECHITNDFTITKYMGLYCDRQGQRDAIQSLLSIGSLVGLVVMNFVSDLRGRKFVLIIDLIVAVFGSLFTIIGAYVQNTGLLAFASFMCGFSGYSLVIVSYIMVGDICQDLMRQRTNLLLNVSYSFGLITYFFMYNWINQWYNVVYLFMLFPFIGLTIVCLILVEQSPNYYLCKRKDKKKCINALTNIAIYNKKSEHDIEKIQNIIMESKQSQSQAENQKKKQSILYVLKQWKYLKVMLFMGIVLGGGNMFFYGIQYAIDDIGFNYGVDNLVLGCTEIVVTLAVIRFISQLQRKKTTVIAYSCTVVLSMLFIINAVSKSQVACTLLIIFIRITTTMGYYMVVMVQTQSFPMQIQSIGAGTIQALSQLGSAAAPLIITFAIDKGFQKMATMGVVLAACLIPLKFVPEPQSHSIKKDELQETLLQSQLQSNEE